MDFPVLSAPERPSTDTPATILIVDDVPENLRLLSMTLARAGYDVRNAINGNLAMMAITVDPPDLILLDISMPDIDGFEVCRQLKGELNTSEIPIIFITALGEALDKVTAFEVGGADYITKPFQIAEVLARVQHQLELRNLKFQLRTQNQKLKETLRQQQESEIYIRKLNQELEQRVVKRTQQLQSVNESLRQEINEKQQAQTRLLHMAMYDSLTGLANRNLLLEELEQTLRAGGACGCAAAGGAAGGWWPWRSRRRKYFCACERICTAVLVATTRSMAFHSRPYLDSASTKRACSSSVQYWRRLVSTYFLRGGLLGERSARSGAGAGAGGAGAAGAVGAAVAMAGVWWGGGAVGRWVVGVGGKWGGGGWIGLEWFYMDVCEIEIRADRATDLVEMGRMNGRHVRRTPSRKDTRLPLTGRRA